MNKYLEEIGKAQTSMAKTIIVDIDGVLVDFENCKEGCDYSTYPDTINLRRDKCPVMVGARESLETFQKMGLKIILVTARVEEERPETIQWLFKHNIPFDEIHFNKPRGFIYIDDLAHKFTGWNNALHEVVYRYNEMHYANTR